MADSPLLAVPGAVPAEGVDQGVPAHYGNPIVEQRDLERGLAIVDCSGRGVVRVEGPDRLSWLDSMASQSLARLAPGEPAEALFLDAGGHVEHAVHVLDDGVATWLVAEGGDADALGSWLDRMRFMLRVEVSVATDEFAVLATAADDPAALLPDGVAVAAPNDVALVWRDPWAHVVAGGFQYATDPEHPAADWQWSELLVPRDALPALAAAARAGTVRMAGSLAAEALRIAAWRPRFATEVDDRSLPHELDWLRTAVHLSKGCYRGQETVAKVHNLGRPPRRLVMLHLDGSDTVLPAHGEVVSAIKQRPEAEAERRAVGTITSSALHHELGPIALAVVKRAVPDDIELIVESHDIDVAASQVAVVPSGAGAAVEVPRLPRLGARR
ncbi:CAF17-like 4Fe-4S cluster assembly/insertion protein YgfZ [Agromyces mangrovi Wang et al. 2018]|uniref:CAF17-like 4Fe-4S cluster assembly/insertion protein YgfZ n=1 Tax=Agromyces mangrovi TaxID=1858653 RepID=UPI0025742D47|nr:folate-binding protein [Agromyces mangrovi]BDZ63714.1 folate-binding protein [Agromyces mangrovi]